MKHAFPRNWGDDSHPGLSRRDYIAIAAMQGLVSHPDTHCENIKVSPGFLKELAEVSYSIADAMEEESNK